MLVVEWGSSSNSCKTWNKSKIYLANAAKCEPILHHNIDQIVDNTDMTIRVLNIMEICGAERNIRNKS